MTPGRIGLLISGAIVLLIAVVVVIALLPAGIGPHTEATNDAVLAPITLSGDPTQLVTFPTSGGDARATYNQAVTAAVGGADWAHLSDFKEKVDGTANPRGDQKFSAILDALDSAAAQPLADGDLVFDALKVNPIDDFTARDLLYAIGKLGGKAARADRDAGNKDKARKTLEGVFIFGWRLWHNGPYRAYRHAGLAVMSEGVASLGSMLDDMHDPKATIAKDFDHAIDETGSKWMDKEQATIRDLKVAPGDLANLALHDKDRTWRIEGVMWLGVSKWTTAGGKQRDAIQKFLEEQSHASDKLYAQTAAAAAAFSDSDKNQLRGE